MTASKACADRFEDIVALVMSELDPDATRELQDHISDCAACRETRDSLLDEEKEIRSGFDELARGLAPAEQTLLQKTECQSQVGVGLSNNHLPERVKTMILAHKRLSFAAATTCTAAAASLILYASLFSTASDAYALEQTAEANNGVTSYHVKLTPAAELGEAWIEVNRDGTPRRARMDLLSPDDGAKVVILSGEKAEVWFKDKKSHVIVAAKDALNDFLAKRKIFDPKLAFERLQAQKEAGKIQVATEEPAKEGELIRLTVTSGETPDRKSLYEVDPDTKLVKRVTHFRRSSDEWKQVAQRAYLDYNKPIDPKIFQLELPEDVVTVDQINQTIGVAKGNLSDSEIATKLAREFIEAVIAEDFDKAGTIYSGIPGETLQQRFQQAGLKFLRLVKIGTPTPHAKTQSLRVPVSVEVEVDGQTMVRELSPFCRAVESQPDRWQMIGGI